MKNGYTAVPNDALAEMEALSRAAILVFVLLLSHRNQRSGRCNPSVDLLAGESGLHRRSVVRAVRDLEDRGFVVTLPQMGRGSRPNAYLFPHVEASRGGIRGR